MSEARVTARARGARVAYPGPGARWALCGIAALGAWLVLRAWVPVDDPAHAMCMLRRVAHVGCAGCGFSRALAALARGDLGASLALHPMALAFVAQLGLGWLGWGVAIARRRPLGSPRWLPRLLAANALAWIVVWLVRLATGTLPV